MKKAVLAIVAFAGIALNAYAQDGTAEITAVRLDQRNGWVTAYVDFNVTFTPMDTGLYLFEVIPDEATQRYRGFQPETMSIFFDGTTGRWYTTKGGVRYGCSLNDFNQAPFGKHNFRIRVRKSG